MDPTGNINIGYAHPWLLQLRSDFDKRFEIVDGLSLDAQIVNGRHALLFSPPGNDESLNQAIQHLATFDRASVKPFFLALNLHTVTPVYPPLTVPIATPRLPTLPSPSTLIVAVRNPEVRFTGVRV